LDAARAVHQQASAVADQTQAHEAEIRASLSAGETRFTPLDLATAKADAEHAALISEGTQTPLASLQLAVSAARADEEIEVITAGLPPLGAAVVELLDDIGDSLAELVQAARRYDDFAEASARSLQTVGRDSPRVSLDTRGPTRVDRIALRSCHADRHLAALIAPTMRALGAPDFSFAEMKMLAEAAPEIVQ
jgi:hypothetical protein